MSRKIVRQFSLEDKKRKAPFVEKTFDNRTTYSDSPRNPRKISDKGLIGSHNHRGSLQSSSRFPRLVFQNAVRKKSNGIVTLNTQCERKYRSWSDPSGEHTGNWDSLSQKGTFEKEVKTAWTMFPRLVTAPVNTDKDTFDEKSFCDSLSSFACSSITSESSSRSILTDEDEEDFFISKRKTVFSWVQHSGSSCKVPEFHPVCDLH